MARGKPRANADARPLASPRRPYARSCHGAFGLRFAACVDIPTRSWSVRLASL